MRNQDQGAALPHSIEAEQAVLACLLNDPEKKNLLRVVDTLQPEDFYRKAHQNIYGTVVDLHKRRESVPGDPIAISNELKKQGKLDEIGGRIYITDLALTHVSDANLDYYVREVRRFSLRRRIYKHSRSVATQVMEEEEVESTLTQATTLWQELQQFAASTKKSNVQEAVISVLEAIEKRLENRGPQGVPSGYPFLDEVTGGFRGKDLTIIAARPGMGKTQFALNLTWHACTLAKKNKPEPHRVCWFSYEMPTEQLIERMYSLLSTVPAQDIKMGTFSDYENWTQLQKAMDQLLALKLDMFDMMGVGKTVGAIAAQARKMDAENNLPDLFVIDHIGFLESSKDYEGNRALAVKEIVNDLKYLAVELDRPFLVLCQLSRENEKRMNKRPVLSDLRESGDIEQTADNVIFIHRDDYYNREAENQGETEIIVAKQRNGPLDTVKLLFQKSIGKFHHLEKDEWSKAAPKAPAESKGSKDKSRYDASAAAASPMTYLHQN